MRVDLGPLQYGQTRSIAVPMAIPSLATAEQRAAVAARAQTGEAPPPYLQAKLEFTRPDSTEVRVVARPSIIPQTVPSANAVLTTLRCDTITTGRLAIAAADAGDMDVAHTAIGGLIERFLPVGSGTKEDESAHAALMLLQSDVKGRLSKALSRKERFERWGKHYLRALLRAHRTAHAHVPVGEHAVVRRRVVNLGHHVFELRVCWPVEDDAGAPFRVVVEDEDDGVAPPALFGFGRE